MALTFITIVSNMTSNILGEEECNSRARRNLFCSLVSLDSSTSQETRSGNMRFSLGIQTPKKYLNLKFFYNIGGAMI
jgi:hypothetical protein